MLEAAVRAGRGDETMESLTTKSRHLLRVLGKSKRCSEITLNTTTEYADTRIKEGAHRHTVKKELGRLIQALRRAQKRGLLSHQIDPRTLMPDELKGAYVPRERWLGHDDLDLLLAQLKPERRDYVLVMAWTGVRLGELHALLPEHYNAKTNELLIVGTESDPKTRRIPLAPIAKSVIARRAKATAWGTPLFPIWHTVGRDLDSATLRIEKALNPGWERPQGKKGHGLGEVEGKAPKRDPDGRPPPKKGRAHPPIRFPSVSLNDLRRSFASWLASSGVPLLQPRN
jgi:integrase